MYKSEWVFYRKSSGAMSLRGNRPKRDLSHFALCPDQAVPHRVFLSSSRQGEKFSLLLDQATYRASALRPRSYKRRTLFSGKHKRKRSVPACSETRRWQVLTQTAAAEEKDRRSWLDFSRLFLVGMGLFRLLECLTSATRKK